MLARGKSTHDLQMVGFLAFLIVVGGLATLVAINGPAKRGR